MEQLNHKIQELLMLISQKPTTPQILVSLAVALGLTAFMLLSYRLSNTKQTYQPRFAVTLACLALITTILMDLIQSNLALSLGMLGSLSIVRFRTTIKDPRDIGFVFWSMAIGLAASTGSYVIGLSGSLVVGLFMMLSGYRSALPNDMMLVIRGSVSDLRLINSTVACGCERMQVKAKNVMADSFELVYEVRVPMAASDALISDLFQLQGIDSVNLLAETKSA